MKLTQRLYDLIEEQDNDEGDVLIAIMLDSESTREEIEVVILDFMLTVPGYSDDPDEIWKIRRYIDANLLTNEEEDLSADIDEETMANGDASETPDEDEEIYPSDDDDEPDA